MDRRLKIEAEHEAQLFGQGLIYFNLENWYLAPWIIRNSLKLTGLYRRARRNADQIVVRSNIVEFEHLPPTFDNFTMLHISDLHVDISEGAMQRLLSIVVDLQYDVCVITGDYRGKTYGPFEDSLKGVNQLRTVLKGSIYGVLGNHDSIRMAPAMEAMGIRLLFNECEPIVRGDDRIYLAGSTILTSIEPTMLKRQLREIPRKAFSVLLSHSPEIYDRAAASGFDLMLSGHTHGGQLCLPGGIPIKLEAKLPRTMGAGAWRYAGMAGYTSVGAGTSLLPVRLNCPPEITLHTLRVPGPR